MHTSLLSLFTLPLIVLANSKAPAVCKLPIDIVLVQDVTSNLAKGRDNIAKAISDLSNYLANNPRFPGPRLGLLTFQDKPISPLGEPYDHCAEIGATLTDNFAKVSEIYESLQSAGGKDVYENQFGALLVAASTKKLGWDENRTKLAVLITDSATHFAKDGRSDVTSHLEPYTGPFNDDDWDTHCVDEDYPSADDVKAALEKNSVHSAYVVADEEADQLPTRTYEWFNSFLEQPPDFVVPGGKDFRLFARALETVLERIYSTECGNPPSDEEKPPESGVLPPTIDPEFYKCMMDNVGKKKAHFPGDAIYAIGNVPLDLYWGLPLATAVVRPKSSLDVANTVICANEHGLNVVARSGGHDYASYSNGRWGDVIIDMRYISTLEVEKDTGFARVGAGIRLGPFYYQAFHAAGGPWTVPAGACTTVGMGGHFSGGGYGYFTRSLGLAADFIKGAEVVLANGTIVTASPTRPNTADLFFALNGAGAASVGIVTYFELQMIKTPPIVTAASYVYTHKDFVTVLKGMVKFADKIPKKLSMSMVYDKVAVDIQMAYLGTKDEMIAALKPFVDLSTPPKIPFYREGDFLTAAAELSITDINDVSTPVNFPPVANFIVADADADNPTGLPMERPVPFKVPSLSAMNTSPEYMPPEVYFKEHSVIWTYDTPLTEECADLIVNATKVFPPTFGIAIELIGGHDSELAKKPSIPSSVTIRDMQFISHLYARSYIPISQADIKFVDEVWRKIQTCASDKVYVNYKDRDLGQDYINPTTGKIEGTGGNAVEAYHEPKLNQLVAVVKKYNPKSQFWYPQAIRPEGY